MQELTTKIEDFFQKHYYSEVLNARKSDYTVTVDFSDIDRYDPILSDILLEDPENTLQQMNDAAKGIAQEEQKITVRVRNLPVTRDMRIRNLRAKHLGKLWSVETIVKAASEVKPQIYEAYFECPECSNVIVMKQDKNILQKPTWCDTASNGCGRRGDFKLVDKKMFDYRWLICTDPYDLITGERPGEITVFLREDLTTPRMQKKTDPGSRLRITGVLKELPKHIKGKLSTRMDIHIDANNIETSQIEFDELDITPEEELEIKKLSKDPDVFQKLVGSIASGIYGYDEIKESIILQLFGGIPHVMADGTRIRGNIHILLTGDPGIGKTMLLKLVSSIVPRGKYVSGTGASGPGLTATVTKNEAIGGWILEAGALILCNKGTICIDEFDKMNKDDQIAMHEATSIETVSIAKASIVATLPAQTAVLAGANPKLGRFDPFRPIAEQINIPETLLSRFDLKFALRDRPDKASDERLAEHILRSRISPDTIEPVIDIMLLKKYIAYAKRINTLELAEEAAQTMKNFYVEMRNEYTIGDTPTVAITLRQYEALLRLAEASAKVRLETKITKEDAERAIRLMKYSLNQLGYDFETGRIDIDRIESGVTASKRKRIVSIVQIIERMHKEMKEIAIEDIKAEAENEGIENAEDLIDMLKRDGTIFEPRPGFIKKV